MRYFKKMKGDHLETEKFSKKMRIFKSHSAEKSERRDPFEFFNVRSVAKYQKNEGRTLGDIKKFSKISLKKPKRGRGVSLSKKVRIFCFENFVKKISAYARVRTRTLWVEKQASYR